MKATNDKLRAILYAQLDFTRTAIVDYATDSVVLCRLGRLLAKNAARFPMRPIGKRD
jgi:hypothetical protein